MIIALKFVVSCDILGLTKNIQGSYFGHAFSKAYQYASIDEIFCKGLKYVSIKIAQFDLHKCITWLKFREGQKRMEQGLFICDTLKKKLNTPIKTRLSLKL